MLSRIAMNTARLLCGLCLISNAAAEGYGLGGELQLYPAGVNVTARLSMSVANNQRLAFYAGYNESDRQDFGEHDNEKGGGAGVGAGLQHYFGPQQSGWYAGGRLDVWRLGIDWRDRRNGTDVEGTTDITVLQPTARGGYSWLLGDSAQNGQWAIEAGLALGAEINIKTNGEDVGEGAILLGGVAVEYRF